MPVLAKAISLILSLFGACLFMINPVFAGESHAPEHIFEQALEASKAGAFFEALEYWDKFLESFPEDGVALGNRGTVRFALGDFEGAISDQTKSIEFLPNEIDSHLNRGVAEEALQLWKAAESDYNWILEREDNDASALYNLGNVMIAQRKWEKAETLFAKAALARTSFPMARSSKALVLFQLGELEIAESELRTIIRKYPMFADARAALSALLWRRGSVGEAESNWAATFGLDNRYMDKDWLENVRRWPPDPISDLLAFLALDRR